MKTHKRSQDKISMTMIKIHKPYIFNINQTTDYVGKTFYNLLDNSESGILN